MMFSNADGRVEGLYFESCFPDRQSQWRASGQVSVTRPRGREKHHGSALSGYVTLFAYESLKRIHEESGMIITPRDAKHHIITRGIDTDMLEGGYFTIGDVTLRGIGVSNGLPTPPHYRGDRLLYAALQDRVGQIAEVIEPGVINAHDSIALGGLATAYARQAA